MEEALPCVCSRHSIFVDNYKQGFGDGMRVDAGDGDN
jgi:hypothetical protein